jgi:hypothetical protein
VATYGADVRDAVGAAIASVLNGSRLFLLSETGTVLAVLPAPNITSKEPGVIETGKFERGSVIASGKPTRYEFRRTNGGLPSLSGAGAELRIDPPVLIEGGLVYVDGFTLTI